jgi:pSer/pThr/pTyr-binding forkhead associated (FHA) protein
MQNQSELTIGRLWTRGAMLFRVQGKGREPDRIVKLRRPFALVGQNTDADLRIDDPAVSARHVYLHLDPRGVYVVDLVSRTGTRIKGTNELIGWLRPGDWFEVAGRRLELLRIRIGGTKHVPPPCDTDLLAETESTLLVGVTLEPQGARECPWVLGSELVVLGGSPACGIQVRDPAVQRTHCALFRTPTAAYAVNLCGQQTWVRDKPVRGALLLRNGDILTLGTFPFRVRVEPPGQALSPVRPIAPAAVPESPRTESGALLAQVEPSAMLSSTAVSPDSPRELLAWMMGTVQAGQGEILRQQGEFQMAMTQLLRQFQQENAALLNAHLAHIERVDRELAALRSEIECLRHVHTPATTPPLAFPQPRRPAALSSLRISRTLPESPPSPQATTAWLLERTNRLQTENRSAWKDLLGRLTSLPRRS